MPAVGVETLLPILRHPALNRTVGVNFAEMIAPASCFPWLSHASPFTRVRHPHIEETKVHVVH